MPKGTKAATIRVSREDLESAVAHRLLNAEQAESLWQELAISDARRPKFDLTNLIYYFGAMVIIVGMTFMVPKAWERFGGAGLFLIALVYGAAFSVAGKILWFDRDLKIPGGLLVTAAVCMAPLAIYGIERQTGIWPQGDPGAYADFYPWIRGSWIAMELGTVTAGLVALRYVRFPFITAPIAFALWFMSMDLTPLLTGQKSEFTWEQRALVSLVFGAAMLLASFAIDRKTEDDYSFWGYLFGNLAFWGGFVDQLNTQFDWSIFCLLSLSALLLSVLLQRRVFAVFGAVGVFSYLVHLTETIFADSVMFPFVLTAIGLLVVFLGVQYQRHIDAVENAVLSVAPAWIKKIMPARQTQ
ncbi:MAG: hypothetical protein WAU82_13635 [Candidatus Binatus sp.]|uniref:DUF2157 domain-containing protein n=1 Tax=Candidatus Binatus sp. TaxID=2811406 RepID=UPI003BAF6FA3